MHATDVLPLCLYGMQEAEEARHTLLELQAVAAAVESSGQSKAEAQARAERLLIEGQSAIECEMQNTRPHMYNFCIYQSAYYVR